MIFSRVKAPPPPLTLRMDRSRYHFNDLDGQAVMRINVSKDLLRGSSVRLSLCPVGTISVHPLTRLITFTPPLAEPCAPLL